jgi:SAM-dependent methyltransferase
MDLSLIEQRLAQLAPWHFNVEVRPGVWTEAFNRKEYEDADHQGVGLIDPREIQALFESILPGGLRGRSFLDVGCNGGGYCFLAHDLGASSCHGFDVRQHWIDQCEFLKSLLHPDVASLHFEVADVKKFQHPHQYDVTLFKGVFYHLPDPITTLNQLCALTSRAIIVDTVCRGDIPEDTLVPWQESTTHVMSGVDGLAWFPGGPKALHAILKWSGFPHMRTVRWKKGAKEERFRGRMRVIAARDEQDLAAYDAAQPG